MKKFFITFMLALAFLIFPKLANAAQFSTSYKVLYDIQVAGGAKVQKEISIANNTAEYYVSEYNIRIPDKDVYDLTATKGDKSLNVRVTEKDDGLDIVIPFTDQVVGLGKKNTFLLNYNSDDKAQKKGNTYEIVVPRISEEFDGDYQVTVRIPRSIYKKGVNQYPKANKVFPNIDYVDLIYDKSQLLEKPAIINIGDEQYFTMTLNYYLENPTSQKVRTEVAIPPNTEFQKIIYDNISPKPNSVRIDEDGNYLAEFILMPREHIDIVVQATAIVSNKKITPSLPITEAEKQIYTQPQKYWETTDEKIQGLAQTYETPEEIYKYVVEFLSYDNSKLDNETLFRLGAARAIETPKSSVCMEFTDLFIAIARAAGIPAREIDGYAYTNDLSTQPVLSSRDILHVWPEYYDFSTQEWIQVDPTWQNTTGGMDYFSSFDTNHIAFVRKGRSSETPYPAGAYKNPNSNSKQLFVSITDTAPSAKEHIQITPTIASAYISERENKIPYKVENTGNTGWIGDISTMVGDDPNSKETAIWHIPPFANATGTIQIQSTTKLTDNATLKFFINDQATNNSYPLHIIPWYLDPNILTITGYTIGIIFLVFIFIRLVTTRTKKKPDSSSLNHSSSSDTIPS